MSAPLTQNLPLRAAIRTLSLVGTLGLAVTLTIATPAGVEQASATSLVASKVGLDIDGEGRGDESGRSVSISGDGTRVAIGAPNNRSNTGRVRIYDWTGSSWTQVGADIDGEAANDYSGSDVSLSSDGSIVAIGAPYNDGSGRSNGGQVRVYKLLNGSWTQVGADIDGEAAGDNSGTSVALSSDGKRVAIGATGNDGNGADSGHVRVYGWNGTSWDQVGADWDQVGADIDGEAAGDYSGNWVALSDDGSRLAVGAFGNDPGGRSFAGHARVFDWNGTTWAKVGADIDGEAAGDYFGYSGAISSNGARLAIGASRNGSFAGHVRVFDWNGSSWAKVGADIDGEAANDQSGFDVSLSSDGSIVAIGAPYNDGSGRSNGGQVRVYKLLNGSWTQVGADIDGEAAGDNSGTSVALSSDGTRVAIGAPMNDGSLRPGHVRVFDFLLAPLTPTFGTTTGAPDGYTVQVLNYDASYGWNVSASAGSAAIDGAGLISVTGLGAGASSTIAVTTTRAGYGSGSANVVATALSSSLTPTFGAPVSTSDGYSVAVSNYDGSFGWAVTTSTGVGSLDSSGLISVTGLSPGAPATVTVDTTRSGYVPGSATVTGVALLSALTPTFGIPASTSDGFTVRVSNFDASHSWTVTASVGTGAIDSSGLITVVGLNAGSLSTVTVGSSRAGYQFGSASLTAGSNQAPAPNPAPPDPPESNPYSGPLFLSVQSAQAGDSVTYLGERLQLISAVSTGGTGLEILALSASELTLVIPATISPGVYDLLVISSEGRLTLLAGLEVFEAIPEPEAITPSIDEKRLTIGTFKGFIAIYTKGYEGQKLSAKVAGKWLVVNPLKESWRQNNYSRTVRFTGAGYDIFVHLYIDGEFIKTELLTTK